MDHNSHTDHSQMDHSHTDHAHMDHGIPGGNTDISAQMDHSEHTIDHSIHNILANVTQNLTQLIASNPNPHDHSQHSSYNPAVHDHSMHDHSASSAGHNHHVGGHMSMTFHFNYEGEKVLFDWWTINSLSCLLWSMLIIFIMGTMYEGLKYYREHLFWKTYNSLQYRAVTVPEKAAQNDERVVQPSMFSWIHSFQTLLHILQVTISFLLMLIFMTYNVWLCIAVVAGAATGYFLFGWKKSVVVDVTEHCH